VGGLHPKGGAGGNLELEEIKRSIAFQGVKGRVGKETR